MNKLGSKALEELRQLLQIALYLYVCLIALLLYASSIAKGSTSPTCTWDICSR